MATSKPPKHDFAPAWLKIPEQDKPNGSKSTEQEKSSCRPNRHDDYFSSGYNRYGDPDYGYGGPLQRQRSFDNYHDEHDRRGYSPQKFRHHSIDDDFYGGAYNYGGYGNHHRSQPSLYKEGGGKYTHPNARYGGGPPQSPMNGGFPPPHPAYDYGYDYYGGDPYCGSYGRPPPPPPPGSKRPLYGDRGGKQMGSGSMADREKDMSKDPTGLAKKELDSIEDDFPSLNGDVERPDPKPVSTSGVWDTTNKDFALSKNNNVYKAQLTTKSSISKRISNRDLATQKDVNRNGNMGKEESATGRTSPPAKTTPDMAKEKSSRESSPKSASPATVSAPMDVNGDCHRPVRDNNNKQGMEDEADGSKDGAKAESKEQQPHQQDSSLVNGIDDLSVGLHMDDKLSSSLEAEQRLLKEMGWNEMDNDDDCFITEEEIQEFQKLKELKAVRKNGFSKPALSNVWSPQHQAAVYPVAIQDLNDTLSSTSEDSDSDLD